MLFHSAILLERMAPNAFWEIRCAWLAQKTGVAKISRVTRKGLLLNRAGRPSIPPCDFLIASLQAKAHTGVGSDPSWQQNMLPDQCPCHFGELPCDCVPVFRLSRFWRSLLPPKWQGH